MSNQLISMQNEPNISFRNTLDNLLSTKKELSKVNYILEEKEKECAFLINKIKNKELDIDTKEKKKLNYIKNYYYWLKKKKKRKRQKRL